MTTITREQALKLLRQPMRLLVRLPELTRMFTLVAITCYVCGMT